MSTVDLFSVGTDCSLQSLSEICFGDQTALGAFKHVENLSNNWVVLDEELLLLEEGFCFDCVVVKSSVECLSVDSSLGVVVGLSEDLGHH